MTIITMPTLRRPVRTTRLFDVDFDFTEQQNRARKRLAEQTDEAFVDAKSDDELLAERAVEEDIRALARIARLGAARDAHRHEEGQRRLEIADAEAHADAVAACRRVASPAARVGRLFRSSQWVSRVMNGVVVTGVLWGSVNVQNNLMAGSAIADPRYWLAFLVEPLITLPLIAIMHLATTASREGHVIAKSKIVTIEAALLLLSIALNVMPHAAAGDIQATIEFGIAPLIIAAVVWMHSFAAGEFAMMIGDSPAVADPVGVAAYGSALDQMADAA
ncbi:hypothetical protein ACQP1G_25635 [Nocardia sp. CA-107356]|uniref:hypothetical protein n=1 Tax=Nocardia sp. CA-107356 TaxID=3239972 RepID=UPI003D8B6089